jgi:type IV pilus biogenesis protein PilP
LALLAALLCCGLGPVPVLADPTSDQLTKIEAETLLLKARERQLDVQASILAKQNEIAAKQNMGNQLTQGPALGDPVVRGIEGIGDVVFATLQLGDGSVIDVQAGDVLSNGMRVVSIAPGNVIVHKGKKRIRLASYVPRPAVFNPNLPAPGLRLPLPAASPRGAMR